jgi:serine/threonine-protein kinase
MSPEQARGEVEGLDEQTDVFALGAILCEILTGQPPYTGSRPEVLRDAAAGLLEGAFTRLDASGAEGELVRLAGRCLDPSRAVRPRNAGVLARELGRFLESAGERARAAEVAAAEARATIDAERKARWRIGVLTLALASALVAGTGLALVAERERRSRSEQSVTDVAALFWKADWFRDQAQRIPPDQLGPWEQALAQVRRTAEIVGSGAPDERTRRNVQNLLSDLRREERRVHDRAVLHRAGKRPGSPGTPAASRGGLDSNPRP